MWLIICFFFGLVDWLVEAAKGFGTHRALGVFRLLRVGRMVRVIRIVRVVKFFRSLRRRFGSFLGGLQGSLSTEPQAVFALSHISHCYCYWQFAAPARYPGFCAGMQAHVVELDT